MSIRTFSAVALVGIAWCCVSGLQRPPPRYSQQYMPDTSFTCRNKIVGSYYADPETDCQLFHVCVSVAGSVQDYKFLCPNDTAFDQESQTCADWYDVDCEAATLYYASDNFDLYRLGSGLESGHYDSFRSDSEPQDHLQRSETSDPIRASSNSLDRAAQGAYNANDNAGNSNSRDILRGSSSINFYNSRNGGKDEDYENEKAYRDEPIQEAKKPRNGVRKVARKQQQNNNGNGANYDNNYASSSTIAPVVASSSPVSNNYNGNYYNNYNRQRTNAFPTSTASPSSIAPDNHNIRNQNNQKYNAPTTTHRPSTAQQTYSTYQSPSTTPRTTAYNNNNAFSNNKNPQQSSNSYGQSIVTSPKTTTYSQNYPSSTVTTPKPTSYNQNYNEQPNYNTQYSQFGQNTRTQSTTIQPSTNQQINDYTNYQRSYNNIQRSTSTSNTFPTTFSPATFQDTYNTNHGSSYAPTTYRPPSNNKAPNSDNAQYNGQQVAAKSTQYLDATRSPKKNANDQYSGQNNARGIDRYNSQATGNDNGHYNTNQQAAVKSTQYYDSTRTPKKATQYNANYDITNNGKYYETSTGNYDIVRSQAGIGFSPSSINHLAETPRSTTPVPKRTPSPTTYSPQTFNNNNNNNHRQTQTTPRSTTYVSGSARPFSTTVRSSDATTPRPKSGKKNDYDYAYYDNAGGLEYDGLDLEHVVAGNKESSKISRN